jgi:hypothetical protein
VTRGSCEYLTDFKFCIYSSVSKICNHSLKIISIMLKHLLYYRISLVLKDFRVLSPHLPFRYYYFASHVIVMLNVNKTVVVTLLVLM